MRTGKIPGWILMGGLTLAGVAGFINAVGLLGLRHPISHVTGNVSLFATSVVQGDYAELRVTGLLVLMFFVGAVIGGFIVQQGTARLGRRYGAALAIESALLFVAVFYLQDKVEPGMYFAAVACGLQNAMVTTYSGAIVRTTHMTGVTTDIGIAVGHLLRGKPVAPRYFMLLGTLLTGFVGGGIVGAVLFRHWQYGALLLPAGVTGAAGLAYFIYKQYQHIQRIPG
ncbi:MAG TPA: YoaK family protein [Gammaproteobacteria bacterium]|nr:YoaK family protein [Gammaproteobacteria bacterium]